MVVNDLLGSCYWSIVRPAFGTASSQAHSGTWVAGRVLSRNELPENFRKTSGTNLLILTAPEELGLGVPMGTIQTLFDYNTSVIQCYPGAARRYSDAIRDYQTLAGALRCTLRCTNTKWHKTNCFRCFQQNIASGTPSGNFRKTSGTLRKREPQ